MVMLSLFAQLKYKFTVAHCNFTLRGNESDADEQFVKDSCKELNVPIATRRFSTKEYAKKNHISIQMAARELRYSWFEELRKEQNLTYITTAHHFNDQEETMIINLLRGSGLSGLRAMLPRQGCILKPLLWANRAEIINYAKSHSIAFREDSSNSEIHYLRNKIRQQLIPLLKTIQPELDSILHSTIKRLRNDELLIEKYLGEITKEITSTSNKMLIIDLEKLKKYPGQESIIFKILSPFGFNESQAEDIVYNAETQSGRLFISNSHRAIINQSKLLVEETIFIESKTFTFVEDDLKNGIIYLLDNILPGRISFETIPISEFLLSKNPSTAQLDYSKIEFPITIRKWVKGDYFYPLGLSGRKMLSDYFTDHKFSVFEKEKVWLVCSGDKIIWLLGQRIDDRYKISENTRKVLRINLSNP